MDLEAAIDLKVKVLEVYGDSALFIHQVKGEWETRDAKLIPYNAHILELLDHFDDNIFHHIFREDN